MKKISSLLVIVMLIGVMALTACGGLDKQEADTPKEEPATEELVAEEPTTEELTTEELVTEETKEEPEIDSQLVGTWANKGNYVDETYVFNDDGTGIYTITLNGKPVEHELTYETKDNKLIITFPKENDMVTREYSIDGDLLNTKTESDDEIDYVRKK